MGVAFQQENSTVFCVIDLLPQMFMKCTRSIMINAIGTLKWREVKIPDMQNL